jgi:small-conductance mechanosensitive channel
VLGVLVELERGLFSAVPGVIAVVVIVLIGRFLTRLTTDVFKGIERGTIHIALVHPETAGATRRLVITLIWLFAVVVAYPLIPGSGSDAFKGVSVFLGLLLTLGSSGVVGHMMSGLVVVYSRALRPGDAVRVTDIEGVVTEVGALSVKLINARKEEFTIPNAVIVGTTVKNYSRLGKDSGPALSTSVTIGYDAPWRVVHELLLSAADRTEGILKTPAPIVYQVSLSDFFVEYQLVVRLDPSVNRFVVLSQLHQNIQDAFNERGVQIMSPHFEGQPDHRVYVPKDRWSAAPGDPREPGGA